MLDETLRQRCNRDAVLHNYQVLVYKFAWEYVPGLTVEEALFSNLLVFSYMSSTYRTIPRQKLKITIYFVKTNSIIKCATWHENLSDT